jgi:iron-sulfur cluster repair protein YtfE (RIC family)
MMPSAKNYRRQHEELMNYANRLASYISSDNSDVAPEAERILRSFAGKLKVHLAMEDRVLYPAMIASPNEELSQTAKRFQREMGDLSKVVNAYLERWSRTQLIADGFTAFRKDTREILDALSRRIDAEEKVLYTLYEQLSDAA